MCLSFSCQHACTECCIQRRIGVELAFPVQIYLEIIYTFVWLTVTALTLQLAILLHRTCRMFVGLIAVQQFHTGSLKENFCVQAVKQLHSPAFAT